MKTDILLINPLPASMGINDATVEVPLGILYIASYLENHGHSCGLLDANAVPLTTDQVVKEAVKAHPLLVGISVNAFSYNRTLEYAQRIKASLPNVYIIVGGPQATVAPEQCLKNSTIDAAVCGEGEITVLQIVEKLKHGGHPFEGVQGVAYRDKDGGITYTTPASRIENIDALPFPAYHLLSPLAHYRSRARRWPFMGIITSRGCPLQCIFCSKDVFGNRTTLRSPENVIAEIEFLVKERRVRQIDILDDNFTMDRKRCEGICSLLIKKSLPVLINLQSGIRVDTLDKELIRTLKRAGVFKIAFGVESGDEAVLKHIRKGIDLEQVIRASQWARETGMVTVAFFMIGLPYETPASLQKTINFAKRMNPHIANFMLTIPFYGTPLYRLIEEKGRFLVDTKAGIESGFYGGNAFFEFGDLTKDMAEYFYKKAYRDFYFRLSKIIDIISTIRSPRELGWILTANSDLHMSVK